MEVCGDEFPKLLGLLAESAPASLASIQRAFENARAADLAKAAHNLKGECGNFGAAPLYDLCAQLEKAGRSGNIEGTAA